MKRAGVARNGSRLRPPRLSRTLSSNPSSNPGVHASLHPSKINRGPFLRGGGLTGTFTARMRPSRRWIERATPIFQPVPACYNCAVECQGGARVPRAARCCVPARSTLDALCAARQPVFCSFRFFRRKMKKANCSSYGQTVRSTDSRFVKIYF
jgi:hypothetical protein